MSRILYLSHPEVNIDPQVPALEWEISDQGRRLLRAATKRGWPGRGWRIIASPETKAQQTAQYLSNAFGLPLHTHPEMGEVEQSTTGDPPQGRFASPDTRPAGWDAAQVRITKAFQEVMAEVSGNLLFVGHGAVGSLLWCALTKTPITPAADRTRAGSFWAGTFGASGFTPSHPWQALETAAAK